MLSRINERSYVTGKPRGDIPEAYVHQRWARSLVEKMNIGRTRKHANLVVFKNGAKYTQDEPLIEANRAGKNRQTTPMEKNN